MGKMKKASRKKSTRERKDREPKARGRGWRKSNDAEHRKAKSYERYWRRRPARLLEVNDGEQEFSIKEEDYFESLGLMEECPIKDPTAFDIDYPYSWQQSFRLEDLIDFRPVDYPSTPSELQTKSR